MLLRAATTFFMVLGLFLAFAFPWLVGAKPHTHAELAHYSVRFGVYVMSLLGCFIAACICALILVRKVRESYREETRQNLEFLLESTLRTHQKQSETAQPKPRLEADEHDA